MKRIAARLSLWIFAIMMVFFIGLFCVKAKADSDYPSMQGGTEVYPSMQGGTEAYPSAQGTAEIYPSMQQGIDITGASITPVGQSITDLEASMITGVSSGDLMFIQEWDVTAYEYPLTVTFRVAGTENLTIYVLSDNENGWRKVDYGAGPTLFVTFTHDTHAAVYVSESIAELTPVENIQIDPIRVYEGVLSQFRRYTPFTVTFKDGTIQACDRGTVLYDGMSYELGFDPMSSSTDWEAGNTYSVKASVLDYSIDVPVEVYGLDSIEIQEDKDLTLILHQTDGETVTANVYYFDHLGVEATENTEGFLVTDHGAFQANVLNYDSCQNVKVSIGGLESNAISSSKWFELNRFAMKTWITFGNFDGTVNQDNIDMLLYDTVRFFSSDELPVLEPPLVYDADSLKAKMYDLFVITADFDTSLSQYYNAERDTIELVPSGVGGRAPGFRIILSDTEQGFLRMAGSGAQYDSLFLLDDQFRIKRMGVISSGEDPVEDQTIKVGDTKKIEPVAGGMAYYQFAPEESGWYAIESFDEESGVSYAYISIYEKGEYRQVCSWGYWDSEHLHMQHRFNAGDTYRIELEADGMMGAYYVRLYKPETYTISFHAGEGDFIDWSTELTTDTYEDEFPLGATIDVFPDVLSPESGKILAGWALNSDAEIPDIQHWDYKVTDNADLYAVYGEPITVVYDCNGGYSNYYGEPSDHFEINTGAGGWFSDNMAYYPNNAKNFVGWYSEPEGGKKYSNDDHMMEDTTVYAHWESPVTVTFDANGGYFTGMATGESYTWTFKKGEQVYFGTGIAVHPDPDMRFAGWYTEKEGGICVSHGEYSEYYASEDVTFYAHWMKAVTVSFDANGGYFYGDPEWTVNNNSYSAGTVVYPPTVQNQDATLVLDGWYDDRTGGSKFDFDQTIMDSVTLYAHWIQGTTITFDANGGVFQSSGEPTRTDAFLPGHDLTVSSYVYKSELSHSNPRKVLVGWATTKDATKEDAITGSINVDDVTTLYAVWEDGIKITEVAGDGYFYGNYNYEIGEYEKNPSKEFYVPSGSKVGALSSIYSGMSGTNYYIQAYTDQSHKKDFGERSLTENGPIVASDYVLTEDTVLYVVWTDIAIVTFDAGDGYFVGAASVNPPTIKTSERPVGQELPINYRDSFETRSNDPTLAHIGWSETGKEDIITMITATEDMTLHAVYKTGPVITFEPTEDILYYCWLNGQLMGEGTNQAVWPEAIPFSDLAIRAGGSGREYSDYRFFGISTTKDGLNLIEDDWYPTENMTLYLVLKDAFSVNFQAYPGCFQSTGYQSNNVLVQKGNVIGAVEIPVYPGYRFAGWQNSKTKEIIDLDTFVPTEHLQIDALWEEDIEQTYFITFVDEDGTVLKEATEYPEGTAAADIVKPEDPIKAGNAQYSYSFAGWDPEIVDVTAEAIYKAIYTATLNVYTITWKNEDGTVLKTERVGYGTIPVYSGPQLIKEGTDITEFVFDKWNPAVVPVNGDAVYMASFMERQISFPGVASNYTGLAKSAKGDWYYLKNGRIDLTYTGIVNNSAGWWRVENGKVNFNFEGIANNENGWWYLSGGKVDFNYTGFAENEYGWWYVESGQITFKKNDVINGKGKDGWWLVRDSKVTNETTVAQNSNGWWRVENGEVNFDFEGIANNENGWWYLSGGKVDFNYTGFAENEYGWWYVESGQITFKKNDVINGKGKDGWWLVRDSKVTNETTVAQNSNGWWYLEDGEVNFDYTGFVENEYGWWYVESGQITFKKNDVINGKGKDGWWLVENSKVSDKTTVAQNAYGWWKVTDGEVDFTFNGLAENAYGWWYLEDGKVNFDYTGFVKNENGWWYVESGQITFKKNDILSGRANTDQNAEGVDGWWLVKGSKVVKETTLASNTYGWWYVRDGKVDFSYTGLKGNANGMWYIENGKVDFDHSRLLYQDAAGNWKEGYVLNTNTGIFHEYSSCGHVKEMSDKNKAYMRNSYSELVAKGYRACSYTHDR